MFSVSRARYIKPYLHCFSPGARASEKGMLYRNNNMNAYARVMAMQRAQTTARDRLTRAVLMMPDQFAMLVWCSGLALVVYILNRNRNGLTLSRDDVQWMLGALNPNEQYVRRSEMNAVFQAHAEAIANTRAHITRPEVLSAPGDYVSRSQMYNPTPKPSTG